MVDDRDPVNAPLYTTEILRLAASLPAPRELERDGSAEQRSPTCGSTIRLQVQVDEGGRVEAVSQEVHACAFGQASASLLGVAAPGRSSEDVARAVEELESWLSGASDDPGSWPGLAALAPARSRRSRHGAILLPFRALLAAMSGCG
jgi:NifU-like protein involved in Fe-S cluster formation